MTRIFGNESGDYETKLRKRRWRQIPGGRREARVAVSAAHVVGVWPESGSTGARSVVTAPVAS